MIRKFFTWLALMAAFPSHALAAAPWHTMTSPGTHFLGQIDSTVTSNGLHVAVVTHSRELPDETFEWKLSLAMADIRGKVSANPPARELTLNHNGFNSLNSIPVIATGGGRTWLLWRDEGPGQVGSELRLIEIPADPLSVDLSSALHLPFAGNSISIRIALAVGDDGLPRVAWVESSLSSVVILRVKNGPTPGNFAYQTVTAPVSSGHSIGSIALAAKNDRVFLTASRSLGTERDLIFTEAIESEESFSFGAVQQVAANNSAGSQLVNRVRITASAANQPAIIYGDNLENVAKLARRDPSLGWQTVSLPIGNNPPASQGVYVDIDCEANSGVLHMVWSKNSSPLLGYARGDVVSGNLQTESLNEISNSRTISVALGSDGAPRLAGQDPYNAQDVAFMLPLDMTDLDANGFTYIEEEALLHLPMTTGGPPGPRFEWQQSGGQTYPALTFAAVPGGQTHGNASYYTNNLFYEIQRSTDLKSWTTVGVESGGHFTINSRRITTYRTQSALASEPRQFLRVMVRRP